MSPSDKPSQSFPGFGNLVPGFDFLQNLATQAGNASKGMPQMPNLGSWVAPTLNTEELDKRIEELKAVQFWLDQNAMALKATIQALEVQKMTLATLKGMNFNMNEVAEAFKVKMADGMAGLSAAAEGIQRTAEKAKFSGLEIPPTSYQGGEETGDAAEEDDEPEDAPEEDEEPFEQPVPEAPQPAARAGRKTSKAAEPASAAPGVVDPMQWWGALTQQFQAIAVDAMKEAAKKTTPAAVQAAPADLASQAAKSAAALAKGMAGTVDSAAKTMAEGARTAMNTALRSSQAWPMPAAAASKPASGAKKPASKNAAQTASKTASKTPPAKSGTSSVRKPAVKKAARKAVRKTAR